MKEGVWEATIMMEAKDEKKEGRRLSEGVWEGCGNLMKEARGRSERQ